MGILASPVLLAATAGLVVYSVVTRFIQWKRLRHIAGQPLAGWTNLWLSRQAATGKISSKFDEACRKYGSLVRIGPDNLICSDPTELRRMWSTRHNWYRSRMYKLFSVGTDTNSVMSVLDNKTHRRLKARVSPTYASASAANQEHVVSTQVANLIALIEHKYVSTRDDPRPCNLVRVSQYFSQDVVSALGFGRAVGNLLADKDVFGLIGFSQTMIPPMHVVSYLRPFQYLFTSGVLDPGSADHAAGWFLKFIHERVSERFVRVHATERSPRKETDINEIDDALQSFINAGLTQSEAKAESSIFLFAGTDTAATALRHAIFYLCAANPAAYRSLQAEIDDAARLPRKYLLQTY